MRVRPKLTVFLKLLPALLLVGTALHAQDEEDMVYTRQAAAPPPSTCSVATSAGTYALVVGGFVQTTANSPFVPTKALGTITVDSSGNVTGSGTVTLGGKVLTDSFSGTATVNADCTGTVTVSQTLGGQTGPSLSLAIVVETNGVVDALVTTPQTVLSGRLRKLS